MSERLVLHENITPALHQWRKMLLLTGQGKLRKFICCNLFWLHERQNSWRATRLSAVSALKAGYSRASDFWLISSRKFTGGKFSHQFPRARCSCSSWPCRQAKASGWKILPAGLYGMRGNQVAQPHKREALRYDHVTSTWHEYNHALTYFILCWNNRKKHKQCK